MVISWIYLDNHWQLHQKVCKLPPFRLQTHDLGGHGWMSCSDEAGGCLRCLRCLRCAASGRLRSIQSLEETNSRHCYVVEDIY
jgi:hypothetical protein